MKDDDLVIMFQLVKNGYAASVKEAFELDVRTVIQALAYEKFLKDFEQAYIEINRD